MNVFAGSLIGKQRFDITTGAEIITRVLTTIASLCCFKSRRRTGRPCPDSGRRPDGLLGGDIVRLQERPWVEFSPDRRGSRWTGYGIWRHTGFVTR